MSKGSRFQIAVCRKCRGFQLFKYSDWKAGKVYCPYVSAEESGGSIYARNWGRLPKKCPHKDEHKRLAKNPHIIKLKKHICKKCRAVKSKYPWLSCEDEQWEEKRSVGCSMYLGKRALELCEILIDEPPPEVCYFMLEYLMLTKKPEKS